MEERRSLAWRGFGLLFSLLTFVIMASNKHGDWKNFDKYEEYRYVLGIAILSTLYTGGQALRQVRELSTGKQVISRRLLELSTGNIFKCARKGIPFIKSVLIAV